MINHLSIEHCPIHNQQTPKHPILRDNPQLDLIMRGTVREKYDNLPTNELVTEYRVYCAQATDYRQHMGLSKEIEHCVVQHMNAAETTHGEYDACQNPVVYIDAGCGTCEAAYGCQRKFGDKLKVIAVNYTDLEPRYTQLSPDFLIIHDLIENLGEIMDGEKVDIITAHNVLHYSDSGGTLKLVIQVFFEILKASGKVIIYQNQLEFGPAGARERRKVLFNDIRNAVKETGVNFTIVEVENSQTEVTLLQLIKAPSTTF